MALRSDRHKGVSAILPKPLPSLCPNLGAQTSSCQPPVRKAWAWFRFVSARFFFLWKPKPASSSGFELQRGNHIS